MNSIFSAAISPAWLDFLGPVALKGAGLLVTALLAGLALRRVSAARRYVLWFSSLLAVGALTIAVPLLPAWRVLPASEAPPVVMEPPREMEEASAVIEESLPVQAAAPVLPPVVMSEPAPEPTLRFRWPALSWSDVAASMPLVWLVIAVALGLRLAISGVRLSVLRRRCAARRVSPMLNDALAAVAAEFGSAAPRLLIGPAGSVPMVWGVVRPCLLLPADADEWPEEKLRAVLLHELEHLRRRDPAALLVAQIAQALHWFNPLVWLTLRRLRADQERACDDAVLRHGVRASDYAQHLLDISQHHRLAPGLGLCALAMARSAPVAERLAAILDPQLKREASARGSFILACIIAALIATPLAMVANAAAKGLRGKIVDRNGVVLAESRDEKSRQYPLKALAAHVIGYAEHDRDAARLVGHAGIEKRSDDALASGKEVKLTVDARVQSIVERVMSGAGVGRGAVIVLDPRSGDVLAMASVPSFAPAKFTPSISSTDWDAYLKNKAKPLMNRAGLSYAPGAAYIPFTALAGVSAGIGDSQFNCSGSVTYETREFRCWISDKGGQHGMLDLQHALQTSCNCYWYQFGNKAGDDAFTSVGRRIGLGEKYGLLDDESAGVLPGKEWLSQNRPKENWTPGYAANASIGQGLVAATPLQLAVLAAAIANGGRVPSPRLVDPDARAEWRADLLKDGLDPKGIERIRKGMWLTVNDDGGSGGKARSSVTQIAGRTGTAQFLRSGVKDNHCWFIGFAPFERPTLAFAVLVQGGKSGGSVCAPIAKRIVEETLALPADGSGKVEPVEEQAGHFKQIEPVTEEEVRKVEAMAKPGSPKIEGDAAKTVKPTADSAASTSGKVTLAPNSNWRIIKHEGRDHVTLENVKTFYRFDSLLRNGNALALRTSRVILKTEVGSREMLINGVKFALSDPVVEIEGKPCVSQLDLTRLIDPVLRPSYIKNASAFDTVVIDPGHGGHDTGAKGVYGIEKDMTLKLGLDLKAALEKRGFKVVMTRKADEFKSMVDRVKLANDTHGSILISLHFNSGDANAAGIETLALTPQAGAAPSLNSQNIALATAIHAGVVTQYKLADRGVKRAPWTKLPGCERPGILFEGGFITNAADGRMIASETYRRALASTMADAVLNYRKAIRVGNPVKTKDASKDD